MENETYWNQSYADDMQSQDRQSDLTYTCRMQQEGSEASGKKKHNKKKREKGNGKGTLRSAVNGLVFGACAALVFCGVVAIGNKTFLKTDQSAVTMTSEDAAKTETNNDDTSVKLGTTQTSLPQASATGSSEGNLSIAQIVDNCMPSVVSITTKGIEEVRSMFGTQQYESQGAGSGIIIGQNDTELLIATNNHVVSGAEEVSVCFDDSSEDAVVAAKVKGTDASNDLAIVAVALDDVDTKLLDQIKIATIGDSESLSVGDQVVAIGNALGYGQSVTTGIVSALDREVNIDHYTSKLIQTDAAINPGNSGGALLNMQGELVGINSAKFASEQVEGMGYAIPIATAKPILENLMNRETREQVAEEDAGFLGVSCQDVSEEAAQYYGIPTGAYIASVEEGSAAQAAGIQKGDIITKFDGLGIGSSSELRSTISYYKQGETVEVVYMRSNNGEYQENTTSVTLAKSEAIEKQKNAAGSSDAQMDPSDEEESQEQFPSGGIRDFFERFYGQDENPTQESQNKRGV